MLPSVTLITIVVLSELMLLPAVLGTATADEELDQALVDTLKMVENSADPPAVFVVVG